MKADEFIYPLYNIIVPSAWLEELADLGMGKAEVKPVEIETSVTHLPDVETVSSKETCTLGGWGSSLIVEAGSPLRKLGVVHRRSKSLRRESVNTGYMSIS